jgi:alkaline phosphatase
MTLRIKAIGSLVLLMLCLATCTEPVADRRAEERPLSVILLIGDGMGVAQISSHFYFGDDEPNFKRFNKIGLVKTNSLSHKVTDSAGAATAIATGVRSFNRSISVSPDSVAVPTILERLRDEEGYQTGLVSLTTITHATPTPSWW